GEHRMEALRLAGAFRARVIDATTESFVFEITGDSDKIETFIGLMLPIGFVEVARAGIVAISRGPEGQGALTAERQILQVCAAPCRKPASTFSSTYVSETNRGETAY